MMHLKQSLSFSCVLWAGDKALAVESSTKGAFAQVLLTAPGLTDRISPSASPRGDKVQGKAMKLLSEISTHHSPVPEGTTLGFPNQGKLGICSQSKEQSHQKDPRFLFRLEYLWQCPQLALPDSPY